MPAPRRAAFTLIELLVVLVVLVALAGLLTPLVTGATDKARREATISSLTRTRDAVTRFAGDMRGYDDGGAGYAIVGGEPTGLPWPSDAEIVAGRADHPQLRYLVVAPAGAGFDAVASIGWQGPYLDPSNLGRLPGGLAASYGEEGDPAPLDAWGSPIVLQLPAGGSITGAESVEFARLVSFGPDGELNSPDAPAPGVTDQDALELPPAVRGDDVVLFLNTFDRNPPEDD